MFDFLKKTPAPLLSAQLNGREFCRIAQDQLPCEVTPKMRVSEHSVLRFVDASGQSQTHALGTLSGWFHFSIRVHPNLGCQADCVISAEEHMEPGAFEAGTVVGVRFQPFFLPGASIQNAALHGKGLFARGLHFSGLVTGSNVMLSCICDRCAASFLVHSYHSGFSNAGYFYSESGKYTLTVDDRIASSPAALSDPDPAQLAALEAMLPSAPDGSGFRYMHPFRCPHCAAPYIDFAGNPGLRRGEYYGNYHVGTELLRYPSSMPEPMHSSVSSSDATP
ncbi:hypothetical protein [Xanthomonas vesicatoria]|uniref:Uncharacterized protein n=2 Tax=Xanthomonas vesicatoria ATCC 35937 TaxID=925775 RepID=F0BHB5_9XANT|nr:hypothetical protein [Xanthomonas vesicatoria]APP76211.1 hypothetical protein BJD12_14360 [Xanthomonas vesicatoria ATCC 35937]EGD08141.1 hypothetical protein XVE_3645 [Xanthomonas vesicatoria ATCC 35937]KTF30681.1 hypothetical protein LMG920_18695 [Xanthomonas vesicatoria]KTF35416.1 hypothetical protein LMG919_13550 [Xanthomonas vesicatoria]MCC8558229.1 hypothetical protein [Xanthomonas vesicatoria]